MLCCVTARFFFIYSHRYKSLHFYWNCFINKVNIDLCVWVTVSDTAIYGGPFSILAFLYVISGNFTFWICLFASNKTQRKETQYFMIDIFIPASCVFLVLLSSVQNCKYISIIKCKIINWTFSWFFWVRQRKTDLQCFSYIVTVIAIINSRRK